MADESINIPLESQNLDYHIVTLLEKIENLRIESYNVRERRLPCQVEIRTIEFWKSVICECLASFIYVFIVCGAAAGAGAGASLSSVMLATALSAGFTMATLNQCFGHISGAHVNPAVSIAMGITKNITMLRTGMFVIAQCGGGIAGAAFLYGVTVPGYQGNLAAAVSHTSSLPAWERFGVEFILTFVVVLTYFVSMERTKRWSSNAALNIGAAYAACTFVSMPYLNPARSLGPSFVLNRWDNHWVYWMGPSIGAIVSGLVYGHIINPTKHKFKKEASDEDSSSIHSDEDTYDDLDKPTPPKFHGSTYNTYRPTNQNGGSGNYAASLYGAPSSAGNGKLERVESLYGGTKSLYCKSPPLTRANLNRSQSVYNKSTSAVNKDSSLPRPGPLVPAQSLYPMRFNQPTTHVLNQNVQNQMQQRSESIYGMRGVTPGTSTRSDNYASTRETDRYASTTRQVTGGAATNSEENQKQRRPDSMYGSQPRRQATPQSEENYGGYSRSQNQNSNYPPQIPNYQQQTNKCNRPSPPLQANGASSSGYHTNIPGQHSPKIQY